MTGSVRERLTLVAEVQLADCREHAWLLEVGGVRPWLGPHVAERYEWQLSAVEGTGLDDIEMDQTVTLVAGFATNVARSEHDVRRAERESGMTDLEWWEINVGPLTEVMSHREYPSPAASAPLPARPTRPGPTRGVSSSSGCRASSTGSRRTSPPGPDGTRVGQSGCLSVTACGMSHVPRRRSGPFRGACAYGRAALYPPTPGHTSEEVRYPCGRACPGRRCHPRPRQRRRRPDPDSRQR